MRAWPRDCRRRSATTERWCGRSHDQEACGHALHAAAAAARRAGRVHRGADGRDAGRFEHREPSQASIVLILLEASSPKGHKGDPVPEYELDPGNNRWMPHRHGSATYEVSFIG